MNRTIIDFPVERRLLAPSRKQGDELARIIIMPVVRVERAPVIPLNKKRKRHRKSRHLKLIVGTPA